jgi:hypothetical protein
VSDFFAAPPPREPEPEHRQPEWLGPPENELGVPVALRVVLARTEQVAVALIDVVAFTTGLEFALEVRLRQLDELSDPFGRLWPLPPSGALTVVTEWPAQGVALTRIALDADPLIEAAAQSEVLWPSGGSTPGGGFVSSQIVG